MRAYVVGYRPRKGEVVQGRKLRPSHLSDSVVGYSSVPGPWVIGDFELAETECRILNRMQVNVGKQYCQFEVEELDEDRFAIVCKSHPELPLEDEIANLIFTCPQCGKPIPVISDLPYVAIEMKDGFPLDCPPPNGCGWSGTLPGTLARVIPDFPTGTAQ